MSLGGELDPYVSIPNNPSWTTAHITVVASKVLLPNLRID